MLANKLFWKIFTTIEFTKDLNDDVVAGNIYYRFQNFNLFDVIITITKHLFNKKEQEIVLHFKGLVSSEAMLKQREGQERSQGFRLSSSVVLS